jgi:hypothetical protein
MAVETDAKDKDATIKSADTPARMRHLPVERTIARTDPAVWAREIHRLIRAKI